MGKEGNGEKPLTLIKVIIWKLKLEPTPKSLFATKSKGYKVLPEICKRYSRLCVT